MEQQVVKVIRRYRMIEAGDRVVVGVSGGADSVCLLSVLLALRETLSCTVTAVHVHHGMRAAAEQEAAFVEQMAGECRIPFYLERVDVPALQRAAKRSPEDAARCARYAAFARICAETGADRLAVAHNRDDQAETVLLQLARGAGLRGFAGIAPVSALSLETVAEAEAARDNMSAPSDAAARAVPVIRPLLFTPRTEIEVYLAERGLPHAEDDSNASDRYARNRIRRHILPCMKEEINSETPAHLAAAARRAREALDYIEEEAARRYAVLRREPQGASPRGAAEEAALQGAADGIRLDAAGLRAEAPLLQKEILLLALREFDAAQGVGEVQLTALLALLAAEGGTKRLDLPNDLLAERVYDELRIARRAEAAAPQGAGAVTLSLIDRTPGAPLEEIPDNDCVKWFDYDKIQTPVALRTRRAGDWLDVGNGRKSLKKELIDRKIPAGERDRLPLLAAGDEILWIVGVRRSEACRVTEETTHILQAALAGE